MLALIVMDYMLGAVGTTEERQVRKKVAVLGHSFVRDLSLSAGIPLSYDPNKIALCRKFFVPGATVSSIQTGTVWERFLAYQPDLTFLIIGGNDITVTSQPNNIARAIIALGKKIKDLTGGEVRFISIERRPVPRNISAVRYNRQRTSINRFLKKPRDNFVVGRLIFSEAKDHDSQDGVHLRPRAMQDLSANLEWHINKYASENNW